jgi:hypothetical protein
MSPRGNRFHSTRDGIREAFLSRRLFDRYPVELVRHLRRENPELGLPMETDSTGQGELPIEPPMRLRLDEPTPVQKRKRDKRMR